MNDKIKEMLNELYKIDRELEKYEKDIIELIKRLLKAKPYTKFDREFAEALRQEIVEKDYNIESILPKIHHKRSLLDFVFIQRSYYAIMGVFVAVIILFGGVYYFFQPNGVGNGTDKLASSEAALFVEREADAFGDLGSNDAVFSGRMQGGGGGGGGGVPIFALDSIAAPENTSVTILPPEIVLYEYRYVGDQIELLEEKKDVLKRLKRSFDDSRFIDFVKGFDVGDMDMSLFQNIKIANIAFNEDRDFGYSVFINFLEGSLSISQNWEKWDPCRTQDCYEQRRLSMSDVPSDNVVVDVANRFLSTYNIDTSLYGDGAVDSSWRQSYETSLDVANFYVPESLTVVYPLKIEEKMVHEQWGQKSGLMVSVDIRTMRVNNVYNIVEYGFERSSYDSETDTSKILEWAEKGGLRYNPYVSGGTVKEIEIGTPVESYVRIWDSRSGIPEEFFVPSLAFPVVNAPADQSYMIGQSVIVPLPKNIMDRFSDHLFPMPVEPPTLFEEAIKEESVDTLE